MKQIKTIIAGRFAGLMLLTACSSFGVTNLSPAATTTNQARPNQVRNADSQQAVDTLGAAVAEGDTNERTGVPTTTKFIASSGGQNAGRETRSNTGIKPRSTGSRILGEYVSSAARNDGGDNREKAETTEPAAAAVPPERPAGKKLGLRELAPLLMIASVALLIIGWQFSSRFRPKRPVDFPFSYFHEEDATRTRRHRGRRKPGWRARTRSKGSVDFPFMHVERVDPKRASRSRRG